MAEEQAVALSTHLILPGIGAAIGGGVAILNSRQLLSGSTARAQKAEIRRLCAEGFKIIGHLTEVRSSVELLIGAIPENAPPGNREKKAFYTGLLRSIRITRETGQVIIGTLQTNELNTTEAEWNCEEGTRKIRVLKSILLILGRQQHAFHQMMSYQFNFHKYEQQWRGWSDTHIFDPLIQWSSQLRDFMAKNGDKIKSTCSWVAVICGALAAICGIAAAVFPIAAPIAGPAAFALGGIALGVSAGACVAGKLTESAQLREDYAFWRSCERASEHMAGGFDPPRLLELLEDCEQKAAQNWAKLFPNVQRADARDDPHDQCPICVSDVYSPHAGVHVANAQTVQDVLGQPFDANELANPEFHAVHPSGCKHLYHRHCLNWHQVHAAAEGRQPRCAVCRAEFNTISPIQ